MGGNVSGKFNRHLLRRWVGSGEKGKAKDWYWRFKFELISEDDKVKRGERKKEGLEDMEMEMEEGD